MPQLCNRVAQWPALWRWLAVVVLVTIMAGCASRTRAPVEDRTAAPPWPAPGAPQAAAPGAPAAAAAAAAAAETDWRPSNYTVKRGDTLYQIALDHGLDYRELAAWNNIENINLIRVGQVLQVKAPGDGGSTTTATGVVITPLKPMPGVVESKVPAAAPPAGAVSRNSDNFKSSPKAVKEPYSEHAVRDVAKGTLPPEVVAVAPTPAVPSAEPKAELPRPAAADVDDDNRIDWVWPAKGKIVGNFSETANLKGIDIAGTSGTPVLASAAGTVVYAGTGLRGYGKLIIIKHNKTYLSAYAHNREILVKEGHAVTRGQKIAEMGNTDATEVKLHFEIRRLGKPMDPARFLPPA
ncbi:MAG: peptidoglycan DD-metalloendopeptidase family protein [Casimicrobiaceae bacterium]